LAASHLAASFITCLQDTMELPAYPEDVGALLQLAMNSSWPVTGTKAVQLLPEGLGADAPANC
jgi:hypothetical protein